MYLLMYSRSFINLVALCIGLLSHTAQTNRKYIRLLVDTYEYKVKVAQ